MGGILSFEEFAPREGIPIYRQIVAYVKRCIVSKKCRDGDEMPSRRVLSSLLGVNPNTVQKAYRILEDEGLIISTVGAKSSIKIEDGTVDRVRGELIREEVAVFAVGLKQMGVSLEETVEIIKKIWKEELW